MNNSTELPRLDGVGFGALLRDAVRPHSSLSARAAAAEHLAAHLLRMVVERDREAMRMARRATWMVAHEVKEDEQCPVNG